MTSADFATPITGIGSASCAITWGVAGATAGGTAYVASAGIWREYGSGNYWVYMGAGEFTTEDKYLIKAVTGTHAPYNTIVDVVDSTWGEQDDDIGTIGTNLSTYFAALTAGHALLATSADLSTKATSISAGVIAVQTDTSAGFANVSAGLVTAYTDMSAGWVNISADMVAMQTSLSAGIVAVQTDTSCTFVHTHLFSAERFSHAEQR